MGLKQEKIPFTGYRSFGHARATYEERLAAILTGDLRFHGEDSGYASHNFHAFPAKFPPQLPRKFITGLTVEGDIVLDPMAGSGTTVVEAMLTGRIGIGFDIDPLALRICKVKTTPLDFEVTASTSNSVVHLAEMRLQRGQDGVERALEVLFGGRERDFLDYWFLKSTQNELMSLLLEIGPVQDPYIKSFLQLALSATIITKSGGVSLARDLAHTRPHKVADKRPRSAFAEFKKTVKKNLSSLAALAGNNGFAHVYGGNAQKLPLKDNSVDLVVTSPPYPSNAIDYMRANKFSLVWLGYKIEELSELRKDYIGHDGVSGYESFNLPDTPEKIVRGIYDADPKKGNALRRYYTEMTIALREMVRVLKPGKAAIVVVGSSTLRGLNTQTAPCLAEIGGTVGFNTVGVNTRELDRDKRMMPARKNKESKSNIENRMHEEYVIGFLKPRR